MYKLIISDDEGKTTVVPLIRDEVTIGRKEGNTIRLTDRNISRFHARVLREEDDFIIEDLKSLCGTKINAKLLKAEKHAISPGDKIAIGDYSLSIRTDVATDVATDVPMGKQMESGNEAGIGRVTPHARLVVLSAPVPGKEIDLVADLYVIGRSGEANCQIKDSSISRAHARIDLDAGVWTISDLDSFNGIIINEQKKDDYVLKAGDVIELGNVRVRFVAPGEPFDFDPEEAKSLLASQPPISKQSKNKPRRLLLLLGGLATAAVIAIAALVMSMGEDEVIEKDPNSNASIIENATFAELMDQGKDAMQGEDWAGAAKLFALAMRKDQSSEIAREFKNLSVKESDSQKNFNSGLEAEAEEDWTGAFTYFSAIPRSSHYYEESQLKHVSGQFCNFLLEKVRKAIEKEKGSEARKHFRTIEGIENAPAECKQESSELEAFLEAMNLDGGVNPTPPPRRFIRPTKKPPLPTKQPPPPTKNSDNSDKPVNPYE